MSQNKHKQMDKQEVISIVSNMVQFGRVMPNGRMAQIAEFCKMVVSGEGENEYVSELRPREDADQKAQRVRVYHSLCKYAARKILKFIERLASVEDVKMSLGFEGKNKAQEEHIARMIQSFHNKKPLLNWCIDAYVKSQGSDPNDLLLLTNVEVKKGNVLIENRVKTTILPSSSILNKTFLDGRLDSVLTTTTREIQYVAENKQRNIQLFENKLTQKRVNDFHYYADNLSIVMIYDESQLSSGQNIDLPPFELNSLPYESLTIPTVIEGQYEYYKVYTFPTTAPCPVFSVSGRQDDKDETVLTSILMDVEAQFRALIARVSELGVTINCHIFPQKYMVNFKCMNEQDGHTCHKGQCGGKICKKCKGSGNSIITSSQDVIQFAIPPDVPPSEVPKMSDMVFYATVDQYAAEFLREEIKQGLAYIGDGCYETNIFGNTVVTTRDSKGATQRNGVTETATKSNLDWQKMYMALNKDAESVGRLWANIVTYLTAINYPNIEIAPSLAFPKDFNFLTLSELIDSYKFATEAQMPYDVTKKILEQIIKKQSPDDKIQIMWALFKAQHKPFADKSPADVATILMERDGKDFDKVLSQNFDTIMDLVQFDSGDNILGMDYKQQREKVKAQVVAYTEGILYAPAQDLNRLFDGTEN